MECAAKSYAMRYGLPVYVDSFAEMELSGRIFSPLGRTIPFNGVLFLLNDLNEICDSIHYPQSTHQLRSFVPEPSRNKPHAMEEAETVDQIVEKEKKEVRGAAATFVVQVRFRQNATWQGTVRWTDTGKTQNFRSTLELINLMEGALTSSGETTTRAQWEGEDRD